MSRNTCLFALLVALLFLFTACRKEHEALEKKAWQPVAGIDNDSKIILNAATDGKQLFTYGPYNIDIIDSQLHTRTMRHLANSLNVPPANGIFAGYIFEDWNMLFFNSYRALQAPLNGGQLTLKDIGPTAKAFHTTSWPNRYVWAIDDNGQVLIAVRDENNTYGVYLVSFHVLDGNKAVGQPRSVKRIALPPLTSAPSAFYNLGGNFFFCTSENGSITLHTVSAAGEVLARNEAYDPELFLYRDNIYMVRGNEMLVSKDGGISFNEGFVYNQHLRGYKFRVVNDRIFAFQRAGLGVFSFKNNGFDIQAVDMSGLEGNYITQLTFFNNKLFVSTLSGLYYKNWEDVFK